MRDLVGFLARFFLDFLARVALWASLAHPAGVRPFFLDFRTDFANRKFWKETIFIVPDGGCIKSPNIRCPFLVIIRLTTYKLNFLYHIVTNFSKEKYIYLEWDEYLKFQEWGTVCWLCFRTWVVFSRGSSPGWLGLFGTQIWESKDWAARPCDLRRAEAVCCRWGSESNAAGSSSGMTGSRRTFRVKKIPQRWYNEVGL